MSTLVTKYIQLGTDSTVSNNYVISTPVSPDGSLRISNGVVGNATDVMVIKPTTIQFSQNVGVGKSPTVPLDVSGTIKATSFSGDGSALTNLPVTQTVFASSAENAAGTVENKAVDPLGIREAFNATGSAPVYACRAWVNFNGTGTVTIRGSGNVSSITDNNVGDYTVNLTTAMPDANYAVTQCGSCANSNDAIRGFSVDITNVPTASAVRLQHRGTTAREDCVYGYIAIFR